MKTVPTQISGVAYNATSQEFEALVTFHEPDGAARYAVTLSAPITMGFEEASQGLLARARAHHGADTGLRSILRPTLRVAERATRPARQLPRKPLPLWKIGQHAA